MKKLFFMTLVIVIGLGAVCFAEIQPITETTRNSKNDFHLEMGGNYSWLNNNYGQWKAFDFRLKYFGINSITPFGAISRQSRNYGSQTVYDFGSYIHFNPKTYLIVELSGAPVKDPAIILYPRARLDISGYFGIPRISGFVLTTGITHIPRQNGNGGGLVSVGGIYYGKIIFSGSVNYNIAQPGNVTSLSGQVNAMYGEEGSYWVGGGAAIGRVAYQLASPVPFDVRYRNRGANLFYTSWLGKNWGFKTRLDHQNLKGAYKLYGITTTLFIDF